jgi:hypothetical protein
MPPNHHHPEDRDDLGPLSPDMKRRRFNGERQQHHQQPMTHRVMPPRYGAVPAGTPVGPGTPFPFGQTPHQNPQMYVPAQHPVSASQPRRESLPGLRGVVSPPGPMGPPPRPGMGYLQHRMSHGHLTPDRSLQLPPLQTGVSNGAAPLSAKQPPSQTIDEVIMTMPFEAKLEVLRKIAPPKAHDQITPRGPLIAIEGDDADAVNNLAKWLSDTLQKTNELSVALLNGPDVAQKGRNDEAMAEYHVLVAQWLARSKVIMRDLEYDANTVPLDTAAKSGSKMDVSTPTPKTREIDENYDDEEETPTKPSAAPTQIDSAHPTAASSPKKNGNSINDIMGVDEVGASTTNHHLPSKKPIAILALFSLHASNTFACRIPLTDTYAPNDHWSWNATQWRGVVGPDLTIYLKDGEEKGRMVEQKEEARLFVVRRGLDAEVDGSTLRRLGFEIGEWVRSFGEGA